MILMCKTRHR